MEIKIKRVYDPAESSDGTRILVDRLWPRGIAKESLRLDLWVKEVAPSSELRKWFSHASEKWEEFQKRYCEELDANQGALEPILKALHKGTVTLLYSSKEIVHNNAVCLKHYLETHKRITF